MVRNHQKPAVASDVHPPYKLLPRGPGLLGSKVGVDPPRRETSFIPMAEQVWLRPLQAGKSGNHAR